MLHNGYPSSVFLSGKLGAVHHAGHVHQNQSDPTLPVALRWVLVHDIGALGDAALAEPLRKVDQVLVIANTRAQARNLLEAIRNGAGAINLTKSITAESVCNQLCDIGRTHSTTPNNIVSKGPRAYSTSDWLAALIWLALNGKTGCRFF